VDDSALVLRRSLLQLRWCERRFAFASGVPLVGYLPNPAAFRSPAAFHSPATFPSIFFPHHTRFDFQRAAFPSSETFSSMPHAYPTRSDFQPVDFGVESPCHPVPRRASVALACLPPLLMDGVDTSRHLRSSQRDEPPTHWYVNPVVSFASAHNSPSPSLVHRRLISSSVKLQLVIKKNPPSLTSRETLSG